MIPEMIKKKMKMIKWMIKKMKKYFDLAQSVAASFS